MLLNATGIEVNAANADGRTPLMTASMHGRGHPDVVRALLSALNMDVNAQDRNGSTALMLASARGHSDVVHLLLRCSKVDITKRGGNGKTALDVAGEEIAETIKNRDQIFRGQEDTCPSSILHLNPELSEVSIK